MEKIIRQNTTESSKKNGDPSISKEISIKEITELINEIKNEAEQEEISSINRINDIETLIDLIEKFSEDNNNAEITKKLIIENRYLFNGFIYELSTINDFETYDVSSDIKEHIEKLKGIMNKYAENSEPMTEENLINFIKRVANKDNYKSNILIRFAKIESLIDELTKFCKQNNKLPQQMKQVLEKISKELETIIKRRHVKNIKDANNHHETLKKILNNNL